ncbi:MAG: hypothetical protein NTZ32_18130 [Planctomycetales bacterium]|nr:hypothetical protein [Planctomycetales bacterium]
MSQELLYTSAPRGLKPGSRGFCTVLSTQGMAAPLATALEGLSGYRPIYPAGDDHANRNPVVYSHLKLQAAGRTSNVLSRIADFGLDYSQRANKLAHHVVLDKTELLPGGPASLLSMRDFMREEWAGDPKVVALKPVKREGRLAGGPCRAWEELTGDAGWAGVLAESFLRDPERLVFLLFAPGQDILPLFIEALSLLPAERRWDVTFSTYFTGLTPGTTCVWRALVHDSKEAHESLRFVNALRLDLTSGSLGLATGDTLVEAARTGVRPHDAKPRTAPPIGPVEEEFVELEAAQVEFASDEQQAANIRFASIPQRPPQLAPGRNSLPTTAAPQPRSGRRLADVIEAESRRPRSRRWLWISLTAVVLIITASFGIAIGTGRVQVGNLIPRPAQRAQALNGKTTPKVASSDGKVKNGDVHSSPTPITNKSASDQQKETVPPSNPVIPPPEAKPDNKDTSKPVLPPKPVLAEVPPPGTDVKSSQVRQPPMPPTGVIEVVIVELPKKKKETVGIHGFEWVGGKGAPTFDEIYKLALALNGNDVNAQNAFRTKHGAMPHENQLLAPSWLTWKQVVPKKGTSDKILLEFFELTNQRDEKLVANLSIKEGNSNTRLDYLLNPVAINKVTFLGWCAIQISDPAVTTSPIKRVFFSRPIEVSPELRVITKSKPSVEWASSLPMDEQKKPLLLVEQIAIEVGGKRFSQSDVACLVDKPARLPLNELANWIGEELNEKFKANVVVEVALGKDTGTTKLVVKIDGLLGTSGIIAEAKDMLDKHRSKLAEFKYFELDTVMTSLFRRLDDKSEIDLEKMAKEEIDKFQLPNLKKKAIERQNKAVNGTNDAEKKKAEQYFKDLSELELTLKDLPIRLDDLHKRYQRFAKLKVELAEARIVSAKISYDLFEVIDTKREKKPIKAYVVDFDDGNKKDDSKSKETKQ